MKRARSADNSSSDEPGPYRPLMQHVAPGKDRSLDDLRDDGDGAIAVGDVQQAVRVACCDARRRNRREHESRGGRREQQVHAERIRLQADDDAEGERDRGDHGRPFHLGLSGDARADVAAEEGEHAAERAHEQAEARKRVELRRHLLDLLRVGTARGEEDAVDHHHDEARRGGAEDVHQHAEDHRLDRRAHRVVLVGDHRAGRAVRVSSQR